MFLLRKQPWVVYCKAPFGGPEQIVRYLGRYVHRVAISNSRLISYDQQNVTFGYKDYRDGDKQKVMTLQGVEFIRRFCLHVLSYRFVKIRYFGMLNSRNRAALERARTLARFGKVVVRKQQAKPGGLNTSGEKPRKCSHCGSRTVVCYTYQIPLPRSPCRVRGPATAMR